MSDLDMFSSSDFVLQQLDPSHLYALILRAVGYHIFQVSDGRAMAKAPKVSETIRQWAFVLFLSLEASMVLIRDRQVPILAEHSHMLLQ